MNFVLRVVLKWLINKTLFITRMSMKQAAPNMIQHRQNCLEMFIAVFIRVADWSLPWATGIQYTSFLWLIFMSSTPKFSTRFSGFPTKNSACISDRCNRLPHLHSSLNITATLLKLCWNKHHATKMYGAESIVPRPGRFIPWFNLHRKWLFCRKSNPGLQTLKLSLYLPR